MNKHQRKMIGNKYGYKPKMKDIAWFMEHMRILESQMIDPYVWKTSDSIWELSMKNQTIKLLAKNINDDRGFTKSMPAVAAAAGWKVLTGPVELCRWNGENIPQSTYDTHQMVLVRKN